MRSPIRKVLHIGFFTSLDLVSMLAASGQIVEKQETASVPIMTTREKVIKEFLDLKKQNRIPHKLLAVSRFHHLPR
jgi:hypothetical protein